MPTEKRQVYVFLRRNGAPLPLGCEGHVGWAFQSDTDKLVYGSTENTSGAFHVPAGGDNGAWMLTGDQPAMIRAMENRDYDAYKVLTTAQFNPEAALQKADWTLTAGYDGLGNNCLDHVVWILGAYGVQGMPSVHSHPSPKDWFGVLAGELHNL